MKYVLYIRVSTDMQGNEGFSLEAQVESCIAKMEKGVPHEVFEDWGSGGLPLEKRTTLMAAIGTLEKGDVLMVYKSDRLGRDTQKLAMLMHLVEKKGARIESATEVFVGADDPHSKLMFNMVAAFAEFERALISMRTSSVLQSKKARGECVGHIPYGYKRLEESNKIIVDKGEQSILDKMVKYSDEGLSLRDICKKLTDEGYKTRKGTDWTFSFVAQMIKKQRVSTVLETRLSQSPSEALRTA
jgi:site-specific DNA recombinase